MLEGETVGKGKRVAIYVRVSTDGQSVENQKRELEAVAVRHGWTVVEVFADHGVSGSKDKRPALDRIMKGVARKDFDMVAAWSVDRLGRSLQHLLGFLGELKAKGVDLFLHQQGLDTSTPAGKAMFQMLGVFAEFERAMIVERVHAGLRRARAQGRRLGRPERYRHQVGSARPRRRRRHRPASEGRGGIGCALRGTVAMRFWRRPRPGRVLLRGQRRRPGCSSG
jgi:DNA invertase Pin-like site-specific DNA recombinase